MQRFTASFIFIKGIPLFSMLIIVSIFIGIISTSHEIFFLPNRSIYFIILGFFLSTFKNLYYLIIFFLFLLFIPGELQEAIIGLPYIQQTGRINLHITTLYIVGCFLGNIIWSSSYHKKLIFKNSNTKKSLIILLSFLALELIVELTGIRGVGINNYFIDIYVGPIILYMLLLNSRCTLLQLKKIGDFFICLLLIPAIIGITEFIMHEPILSFYEEYYQKSPWYAGFLGWTQQTGFFRITSTLGHPLINATYYLVGALYSLFKCIRYNSISSAISWLLSYIVFIAAILFTGSRWAIILVAFFSVIILLYNICNYSVMRNRTRFIIIMLLLTTLAIFSNKYLLLTIINFRPLDLTDASILTRIESIRLIINGDVMPSLIGAGLGTASQYRSLYSSAQINFEIGWLIALLEIGLILFMLYIYAIGKILTLGIIAMRSGIISAKLLICIAAVILMFAGYKIFGNRNTINYLLWLLLGILNAGALTAWKKS